MSNPYWEKMEFYKQNTEFRTSSDSGMDPFASIEIASPDIASPEMASAEIVSPRYKVRRQQQNQSQINFSLPMRGSTKQFPLPWRALLSQDSLARNPNSLISMSKEVENEVETSRRKRKK